MAVVNIESMIVSFGLSAWQVVPGCTTTQLWLLQNQSLPSLMLYCSYSDEDVGCSRFSQVVCSHLVCVSFSASASFCGNDLVQLKRSRSENVNVYSVVASVAHGPSHISSQTRVNLEEAAGNVKLDFRPIATLLSSPGYAESLTTSMWRWTTAVVARLVLLHLVIS